MTFLIPGTVRIVWYSQGLCQLKLFVFVPFEHFEFHVQVVERIFGPRNSSKPVLAFIKVHIVGASQFLQGCCSVVSHFRFNFVVWRSEKDNFILEKRVKQWLLEINKLVFIVNLIRHDFVLWKRFHIWNIPTNSNYCECKGATAVGNRRRSTFPCMKEISILGNSHCNSKNFWFQIQFVNFYRSWRELQRKGACGRELKAYGREAWWQPLFYKQSPASTQIFRKNLFISAKSYENDIVGKEYCITHHDDKTCSLRACRYYIILLEKTAELLHKLDTFCFTYQHVDCLYTLFKYRFSGKVIAKSGNVFDIVKRAISLNQRNRGVDKMASIARKRFLRKKFKQHFMRALQKNKSTQTSGSVFAERIEKVKKTKFELELLKIVDCFRDGHGSYDNNLVSFKVKSL